MIKYAAFLLLLLVLESQSYAEFVKIKPISPRGNQGKFLSDILSQSPNPGLYSDPDLVTSAHENIHGINSRIRQLAGVNTNGFYLLNGIGYIIKEPKNFTLTDVAKSIPPKYRGQIYNLYLIDAAIAWNNQPSYIFDEAVAYQGGTLVGIDLGLLERAEDSFFRALEMNIYAIYMTGLSKDQDIAKLARFLTERNIIIYNKLPKNNPKVKRNYQYLLEVMKDN